MVIKYGWKVMTSESLYTPCRKCGHQVQKKIQQCPNCGKKLGRFRRFATYFGFFWIGLIVIGLIASHEEKSLSPNAGKDGQAVEAEVDSADNIVAEEKNLVLKNRPDDQSAFLGVIRDAIMASDAAANDMVRGGILAERTASICDLPDLMTVRDWTGHIKTIDSNSDGKGVLSVSIFRNVNLQTWNNAMSDVVDETLLTPGSSVFNAAAALKKGDPVRFSGAFISDTKICIGEQSMSLIGKLEEPEFSFKFSSISMLF
jgi:hypothetical protein